MRVSAVFVFWEITVLGRFRPVECEKNWVLLWVLFMGCSLLNYYNLLEKNLLEN